jgi:N-acetylated-alpha-linked acidic dipeptidase
MRDSMRRLLACFTLLTTSALALTTTLDGALRGYTPEHASAELQWEQKFRAVPDAARLRENMRHLTARPHHVGSPYDKANAEWLLAQLKSYGLDAQIEQFDTLFPTPKSRSDWERRSLWLSSRSRRFPSIRLRTSRMSSFLPITPSREMAM